MFSTNPMLAIEDGRCVSPKMTLTDLNETTVIQGSVQMPVVTFDTDKDT